jgi:small-conductance mechanosensitive channel
MLMLQNAFRELVGLFTLELLRKVILAAVIAVVGLLALRFLSALINRMTRKYLSQQYSMLLRKAIQYTGAVIVLFIILSVLGVKITALLGAAGIVGIAVGFAAQTSMSNLISGLFLISEKPFQIGDAIKVGDKTGVILSIDLLSVKIQTFDNQYIRIPNSLLINTELTNVTRFPIRRLDIRFAVPYDTDVSLLRRVLLKAAASTPNCLDEPEPIIVFNEFGESGMQFLFGVWFHKPDQLEVKNSLMQRIKESFDAEGIRFALPARALHDAPPAAPGLPPGAAARGESRATARRAAQSTGREASPPARRKGRRKS